MSTYAIADAINKLADNIKYAISEKNQIEKDKLVFEKEKFEFYKRQLNLSESAFNTINNKKHYDEISCNHRWVYECTITDMNGCKERHRCAICGETKTMEVIGL